MRRLAAIAGGVVLLHAAALWALGQGLARPPVQIVLPAMLVEMIAPPAPPAVAAPAPRMEPAPPAPLAPARPVVRRAPLPRPAAAAARPIIAAAQPQAMQNDAAPSAPVVAEAAPPAPSAEPAADQTAASAGLPAPAAAPVTELSSSDAAYLSNPKPLYPTISRRLGESGRAVIRVLFGADGRVHEAHIQRSSGFERLDRIALETVRDRWRYVPGGAPQARWFDVPIDFVLNQARPE